jgi:hypothetical protein
MTDEVGLFDAQFRPLVPDGVPIKAMVTQPSKVMEHPLEDGATVADHRVFQPVEIELSMVAPLESYQQLFSLYRQTQTLVVRTKVGTFENMIIETLPHDETPDVYDKVAIAIKLREVQFVETQFQALPPRAVGSVPGRRSRNESTTQRGEQSARPATAETERRSSVLLRSLQGLGALGGG